MSTSPTPSTLENSAFSGLVVNELHLPSDQALQQLAAQYGTPLWVYDHTALRQRIDVVAQTLTGNEGLQARYAMKAASASGILREMRQAGIWIDAVSANEVRRALHVGYGAGHQPPEILYTTDVFRDGGIDLIQETGVLPNLGSPGMLRQLIEAGYDGPVAFRINPGFGHGHVRQTDTGGPSSKHGIWYREVHHLRETASAAGIPVTMLHAHIGSGPRLGEFLYNMQQLTKEFCDLLPDFPEVNAVSLGGGIPHSYQPGGEQIDPAPLAKMLVEAHERMQHAAGRELRLEIEPGRYLVAGAGHLLTRVHDVKQTHTNDKGPGMTFAMVDAGFVDLVRPAMYGAYHQIEIAEDNLVDRPMEEVVVAGPLCESGDVFTQDDQEFLVPREMPLPRAGDLMIIRDAGAYGFTMSSNYNSLGRPPQILLREDGSHDVMTRRETFEDILRSEEI